MLCSLPGSSSLFALPHEPFPESSEGTYQTRRIFQGQPFLSKRDSSCPSRKGSSWRSLPLCAFAPADSAIRDTNWSCCSPSRSALLHLSATIPVENTSSLSLRRQTPPRLPTWFFSPGHPRHPAMSIKVFDTRLPASSPFHWAILQGLRQ